MSRRWYAREFKVWAVKLVNPEGYTATEAAGCLGVDPQNKGSRRGALRRAAASAGGAMPAQAGE